ncbi:MAG: dethiobiotin synthase [Chlamydiales bacterium]|jgi:dethiobiotin synthetase|nr:dethiobiotin synthase [Chlamydiales bacterium]
MYKVMVAGIGTGVGKTIISAILATLLNGDYWKPIQCGEEKSSDTAVLKKWLSKKTHTIHVPAYSLKAPLSPHHAARLENIPIHLDSITLPQTTRPLIIESIGGVFVPLTSKISSIDLFKSWDCKWIIVSKHYLGSINHTLLTIEILKKLSLPILGLIFNGEQNPDSESAILEISKVPVLERLLPEANLNSQTIQRYAKQWKPLFSKLLP